MFDLPDPLKEQGFALRPETPADLPFLTALYASTREAELGRIPWPTEQKAAFVRMQFEAQRSHYRTHSPAAAYQVLAHLGAPVGRLYWQLHPSRLHVMEIALAPERQGRGLGTTILQALITAARSGGRSVTINVDRDNRALQLYRRLGFTVVQDDGLYLQLERS